MLMVGEVIGVNRLNPVVSREIWGEYISYHFVAKVCLGRMLIIGLSLCFRLSSGTRGALDRLEMLHPDAVSLNVHLKNLIKWNKWNNKNHQN